MGPKYAFDGINLLQGKDKLKSIWVFIYDKLPSLKISIAANQ